MMLRPIGSDYVDVGIGLTSQGIYDAFIERYRVENDVEKQCVILHQLVQDDVVPGLLGSGGNFIVDLYTVA